MYYIKISMGLIILIGIILLTIHVTKITTASRIERINCESYRNAGKFQQDAQLDYEKYKDDETFGDYYKRMDRDGDHIACEDLPTI